MGAPAAGAQPWTIRPVNVDDAEQIAAHRFVARPAPAAPPAHYADWLRPRIANGS